jgi:hypothetical protein
MGRLTFDGLFCDIAKCKETPGGTFCENGSCSQRKVWERLKEYEDKGVEPDMIEATINGQITLQKALEKYTQAEEQGRLVVLPCKVGTPVYTTRWWDEVPETCIDSKGKKFQRMTAKHKVTKEEFSPFSLDYVQFGEKVFLTREEAERALEGGNGDGQ